MTVDGNSVHGTYLRETVPPITGYINGTISGNVLSGTWREGDEYGPFSFTMAADCLSWSGYWMHHDGWVEWGWQGQRNYSIGLSYEAIEYEAITEITVYITDYRGDRVTEPHELTFSSEPEGVGHFILDSVTAYDGEATVEFLGPERTPENEALEFITVWVRDTTVGEFIKQDIPLGVPLAVTALPKDQDYEKDDVAIIPADVTCPAKISAQVGGNPDFSKEGRRLLFEIYQSDYVDGGELRSADGNEKGASIEVLTDEEGRAEVFYHWIGYDLGFQADTVTVTDLDADFTEEATVQIGLGLNMDFVECYLTGTWEDPFDTKSLFGLMITVSSQHHPGLNLETYAMYAQDVWKKELGVHLEFEWQHEPKQSWFSWWTGIPDNTVYKGPCSFDRDKLQNNILWADTSPSETPVDYRLPGMIISSDGQHLFQASAMLEAGGKILDEDPVNGLKYFLAEVENASGVGHDLLCALQPTSKAQFVVLEALKALSPVAIVGIAIDVSTFICKLESGDILGAAEALGMGIGSNIHDYVKELDYLTEKERDFLFPKGFDVSIGKAGAVCR